MIRFRIAGTRVAMHPLMLLAPILGAALGRGRQAAALAFSLGLHEAAHLICARLLGVRVDELRLMPIGGATRLGNLYLLSPGRLFAVAAAGPAANLGLVFVAAALAQWGLLAPDRALELLRCSLTLMLFNLLPALPLDGGRMLWAITQRRLGRLRAAQTGIWLGRALAAGLVAAMLWGLQATGRLNLSPLLAAVFILSSAEGERTALAGAQAASVLNRRELTEAPVDVRLRAAAAECPLTRALGRSAPDGIALCLIYEDGRIAGWADDRQLLAAALADPAGTVGDVLPKRARRAG